MPASSKPGAEARFLAKVHIHSASPSKVFAALREQSCVWAKGGKERLLAKEKVDDMQVTS